MELKKYQKKVIDDLSRYMELLDSTQNISLAFKKYWEEKSVSVGVNKDDFLPYQQIISGVPDLCLKVPTGGGKTYLACNSVKTIFDGLPHTKIKIVVWLVPSDAILSQTIKNLKDTSHPYRQRLDLDFGGRVEVYSKEELLNGQNFNITSVSEQLSVCVLSYDSFRGKNESLKAKRENSNLVQFHEVLGDPEKPIEGADSTSLLQIINQLSPLVIVDESHHARSELSKKMLNDFNPCFVLDLTATPRKESNIISFVDAIQLKREHMVKLPVIVYNRNNQSDVLTDAIDARNNLEKFAEDEEKKTGKYIRPIVLFQAEPKTSDKVIDYEKLKSKIVSIGIPEEQIAIKTSDTDELKDVNLLSKDCEIRYIITVNALKEGWDCPFAYILATLANKTSVVDVEQILGRVLRQPYTEKFNTSALNMSYALTSSNDFSKTLDNVVKSLQGCGFTEHDYRNANEEQAENPFTSNNPITPQNQVPISEINSTTEVASSETPNLNTENEPLDFNPTEIKNTLSAKQTLDTPNNIFINTDKYDKEFDEKLKSSADTSDIPEEIKSKMKFDCMKSDFQEEALKLKIPQFFQVIEQNTFIDGNKVLLTPEALTEDFSLSGQPYDISFDDVDSEIAKVDIGTNDENKPRAFKVNSSEQKYIKKHMSSLPQEQQKKECIEIIYHNLDKLNSLDSQNIIDYITLIINNMDKDTLSSLVSAPQKYAKKISLYIKELLTKYREEQFKNWIETGRIVCEPSYKLHKHISPLHSTDTFERSLYDAEETVDGFEAKMLLALSGMDNIKWWHRNISTKGLCLNGFINHYPDFIVMTKSGKILLIETKGDFLENPETKQRNEVGRKWQMYSKTGYQYYMVFETKKPEWDGAVSFEKFTTKLLPNF